MNTAQLSERSEPTYSANVHALPGGSFKTEPASNASTVKVIAPVFRVLNGPQQGAEARLRHTRLLVGTIESECDVVLDVGRATPHACLIRIGREGWTVLAIAGDLWVGSQWVAEQQTCPISSGDVLTLGEVSFGIAQPHSVDWATVALPTQRQPSRDPAASAKTSPKGMTRRASDARLLARIRRAMATSNDGSFSAGSSRGQTSAWAKLWHRAVLCSLVLTGLAFAGAGVYFVMQSPQSLPAVEEAKDVVPQVNAMLADLPWAGELSVQADTRHLQRVVLSGYLPERSQVTQLDAALSSLGLEAEHRWVALDEAVQDLTRRLGLQDKPGTSVRYASEGRFVVSDLRSHVEKVDPLIRRVLQDMPVVRAIDLEVSDALPTTAQPLLVQYTRSEAVPEGVLVAGLSQLQQVQKLHYDVRELRLGNLPSVVLSDGARYFEGSNLPGGATLVKIQSSHLVVQLGTQTHRVEVGVDRSSQATVVTNRSAVSGGPKGPGS